MIARNRRRPQSDQAAPPPASNTLAALLELVEPTDAKRRRSLAVERQSVTVRRFQQFLGRPPLVTDLQPAQLSGLADWLTAAGMTPGSVANTVGRLRTIRQLAIAAGKLPRPSTLALPKPPPATPATPTPTRGLAPWSIGEINRLLAAARATPGLDGPVPTARLFNALLLLLLDTRCHLAAALALDPPAFDRARGRLAIGPLVYALHPLTVEALGLVHNPTARRLLPWPREYSSPQSARKSIGKRLVAIFARAGIQTTSGHLFQRLQTTAKTWPDLLTEINPTLSCEPAPAARRPRAPLTVIAPRLIERAAVVARLRDPSTAPDRDDLTTDHKLSEFFTAYFRPVCMADMDEKTVRATERTLALWIKYAGDPPADQITNELLDRFARDLATLPGKQPGATLRPLTIKRHKSTLESLIRIMCKRRRSNPYGLGLLKRRPFFTPERSRRSKHRRNACKPPFFPHELAALDRACDVAQKPRLYGIPAPLWYRALIRAAYNTSWRIETLMALRYSWIGKDGWVTIPPEHYKHCREGDDAIRFPFNIHAQAAIDMIRTPGRDLVFIHQDGPAPTNTRAWDGCSMERVYITFKAIKQAAGLPTDGRMFHAIRRAAAIGYERIARGTATYMLGHSTGKTTDQFYVGDGLASDYANRLPQPWADPTPPPS